MVRPNIRLSYYDNLSCLMESAEAVELSELGFAERVAYIEEVLEEDEPTLLTLSNLVKFYISRLEYFLKTECGMINATRFR